MKWSGGVSKVVRLFPEDLSPLTWAIQVLEAESEQLCREWNRFQAEKDVETGRERWTWLDDRQAETEARIDQVRAALRRLR